MLTALSYKEVDAKKKSLFVGPDWGFTRGGGLGLRREDSLFWEEPLPISVTQAGRLSYLSPRTDSPDLAATGAAEAWKAKHFCCLSSWPQEV